jgi:hypothetical protein
MPRVGFEPTIRVFERVKTVHALSRAITVIGRPVFYKPENTTFQRLDIFPSSVAVLGPLDRAKINHCTTQTLCFLVFSMPDDEQSPKIQ